MDINFFLALCVFESSRVIENKLDLTVIIKKSMIGILVICAFIMETLNNQIFNTTITKINKNI